MTIRLPRISRRVGRSVAPRQGHRAILAAPMAYDPDIPPPSALYLPFSTKRAPTESSRWSGGPSGTGVRGDRSRASEKLRYQRRRCPAYCGGVLAPGQGNRNSRFLLCRLGAQVSACMVLRRSDAEEREHAGMVRAARFAYLAGGSVLHLRSVLKSSAVWTPSSRPGRPVPCWQGHRRGPWCSATQWWTREAGRSRWGWGSCPSWRFCHTPVIGLRKDAPHRQARLGRSADRGDRRAHRVAPSA